jgi:hypothetical protein
VDEAIANWEESRLGNGFHVLVGRGGALGYFAAAFAFGLLAVFQAMYPGLLRGR